HALDHVVVDRIHDLDDGQALLRIEFGAPDALDLGADVRRLDRFVVGEEHRDQAGVGGALHVVLAAQGVQAGAGTADLAGDQRQRDQAARIVGAVGVLRHTHAPEDDRRLGAGEGARHLAQRVGRNAADRRHFLRHEVLDAFLELVEALDIGLDVLLVVELLGDDGIEDAVEHRHVGAVLELQHAPGVALERLAARIHDDEPGVALGRLLEEGGGDRVVLGRIGADDDDDVGVLALVEGRRHRARADAFQERRHRRGVAQPRAVVDIVGAEAGAHQLLEQVGLFVRALGRAEAGERLGAVAVADGLEAGGGAVERLLPGGLAEMRPRIGRVDKLVRHLGHAVLADHRLQQALRIADIVEAEAAFDAEPVLVGRAVLAGDVEQLVVLDVIGELAADAAIGADRVDGAVGKFGAHIVLVDQRRRHQRAGRTGLHAFAAGDTGRGAHRIVEVEHDLLAVAAAGHADDVVDLNLAAGADAEIAADAGVEIDRHRRMAAVGRRALVLGEAADRDVHALGPGPELGLRVVRGVALGLVGNQQLEHHLPRRPGAVGGGLHLHAFARRANAARRQHALALDLHHAGAAIAVGAVAGLGRIAQVRDVDAFALGDLPDGLARLRRHLAAVEREFHRLWCLVHRVTSLPLAAFGATPPHKGEGLHRACGTALNPNSPTASSGRRENTLARKAADWAPPGRGRRLRRRASPPTAR